MGFFPKQKIKSEIVSQYNLEHDSAAIKETPPVKCKIVRSQIQGHFSYLRMTHTSEEISKG